MNEPLRLPKNVLDAFPTPTFVVDVDLRVVHLNAAARTLVDARPGARAGDLLGCAGADRPDGCGASAACRSCPLREAAAAALESGAVVRRRAVIAVSGGGPAEPVPLLVGAAPAGTGRLVVLALEDVTELTALRAVWSSVCTRVVRPRRAAERGPAGARPV